MNPVDVILPEWDAPESIYACCTTRQGGVSKAGFESLNLATHVADDAQNVDKNRLILKQQLSLPSEPQWLNQTHTILVADLDRQCTSPEADAAITSTAGKVAVVMTADCLPVLFCNQQGTEVGAAHAGWRGLLNGILEQTVSQMKSQPSQLMAWLGPAISAQHFEVGAEVLEAFTQHDAATGEYFFNNRPGHYLADLYAIASYRLKKLGISHISGGQYCTYADSARFFSYRRDKNTGRQASLIYIKE